jgi:Aspartyl protease
MMKTFRTLRITLFALAAVSYTTMTFPLILKASSASPGAKIEILDGRPVGEGVFINGHGPYRFLLDTGANVNLIESRLAHSIGMEPTLHSELTSSAGVTAVSGNDAAEVALDSVKARPANVHFLGPGAQPSSLV